MRLKQIMAETGVTQQQVADGIGMSLQAINNYIHDKREPNIATLIKLADYFGVSVDYLIGRDVPAERPMPGKAFVTAGGQTVALDPSAPVRFRFGDQVFELILAEDKE